MCEDLREIVELFKCKRGLKVVLLTTLKLCPALWKMVSDLECSCDSQVGVGRGEDVGSMPLSLW